MNISSYKTIIFAYIALCLVSFILCFALLTPVKVIQKQFLPSSQVAQIKLSELSGNLWQGSLVSSYKNKLKTNIYWSISPSHLLSSKPVIKISLSSAQSQLSLHSDFQGLSAKFVATGNLDSREISSQLSLPKGAKMTGKIHIENLDIANKPPYFIAQLKAHWDGGRVSADNKSNYLPALNIKSTTEAENLIINISKDSNKRNLLQIIAMANKQAEIKITQGLLNLTKQGKLSDDETEFVIRFTEKLTF